jgi:type IV secretory pathway TrbD component
MAISGPQGEPATRRRRSRPSASSAASSLAMLMGAATFNLFYSFLAGLLMFGGLYGFAVWATRHDPDMLRILLSSTRHRRRFDPAKHERMDIEVAA